MRSGSLLLTLGLITGATPFLEAQAAPAGKNDAPVRAVVERYLHGLKFNDTTSFHSAFWPQALLLFVQKDGTLGQLSQAAWYKMFAGSAGKEEQGELRIAAIDVTGDIASVKVVEVYPKSEYIDYLNLVRFGGEWRIVNKVYTSKPR